MQSSPQRQKKRNGAWDLLWQHLRWIQSQPKLQLWWGTFAHDFELSQWPDSNGASKQVFSLKQPFPKGRTGLYSALDRAASILGNAQFADTVFLVTDGGDKFRTGKPQQVVESVAGRGVRDFVFLVDSGVSKTPEVREAPENMEELRRQTGGRQTQA